MNKKIICSIAVVFMLSLVIMPVSGAINITKDGEDIERIMDSGYEVKMFFIGRIDDLRIEEHQTSFYPVNMLIIAIQKIDGTTSSYMGHIKSTSQRFYIPSDDDFRGILTLRFICGGYRYQEDQPETPTVTFAKVDQASVNTLTVVSVDPENLLWEDISLLIGSIGINHGKTGTIQAGDVLDITSYAGTGEYTISLRHKPTNTLIGVFDFTGVDVSISFRPDMDNCTLTVVSVFPSDILWTDIRVEHDGMVTGHSDDGDDCLDVGEYIFSLHGHVEVFYEPTDALIGTWEFPGMPPIISFTQNDIENSLTVVFATPNNILWDNLRIDIEGGLEIGISDDGDGIVEPSESIFGLFGHVEIWYIPTDTFIGSWEFPEMPPFIQFIQNVENKTLLVSVVFPDNIAWSNLHIEHEGYIIIKKDDGDNIVEPGEGYGELRGHVEIWYTPLNIQLGSWEFPN